MAKITWKGEAEGPLSCTWKGIAFPAGRAVEVDDPWMIAKARGNQYFKVEDEPAPVQWREPETEADPADVNFFDDPPPSTDFTDVLPPDYPPEDDPEREPSKRKRGRPPNKVKENGV
jgi:hypothetical protein